MTLTRSCALQESGENGTTRLAITRYDRHRAVGHRQVEQRSISCTPANTCKDRLVSRGGTVGALSSRSGEYSVPSRRLLRALTEVLVPLVVWHTQRSTISTAAFAKDQDTIIILCIACYVS